MMKNLVKYNIIKENWMKIKELLQEFLKPKKPDKIIKSVFKKTGLQGTVNKFNQRQFDTPNGNNVKVHFKPQQSSTGQKSVDIDFYVNNSLDDDSSTKEKDIKNDYDILSGVMYVILDYLKNNKISHFTFHAYSGERDTRRKFNLPLKNVNKIVSDIDSIISKIASFKVTDDMVSAELARRNQLLAKVKRPLLTDITILYKDEMISGLTQLKELVLSKITSDSINRLTQIESYLGKHDITVNKWLDYHDLLNDMHKVRQVLLSHTEHGVIVTSNRRLSVYSKLLKDNLASDWDIEITGDSFEVSKKP